MNKIWTLLVVMLMAFMSINDAEAARRLGGGGSVGRQSSNVSKQQTTPPSNAVAPQKNAAPQQPAAPAAQPSRWGGMLGGLAAGLGLAWLAHSLGFGAGFGNILMFALLAMVALAVFGAFMRRRAMQQGPGDGFPGGASPGEVAPAAKQYNPDKVGNDASARPWERNTTAFESNRNTGGSGLQIGSALAGGAAVAGASALEGSQSWGVPAGFDTEGFLGAAKRNFVTLQDAWDRSDLTSLRTMMTDEMFGEIRSQLSQRDAASKQRTQVEQLEARLLGIEETDADYLASVEFSGLIREEPSSAPESFREVWNMSKAKDGRTGWLVAGLQALQ